MKAAKALLFPSLAEGFGLPVLEAFAAQVPVITSTTTSLPEVAGDAALLIDPIDTGSITTAMNQVLDDVDLRTQLIQRGLNRANTFTWQRCAEQTVGCYRHFLAQ
jgi:alpha-1,3-rhamnosyl/mannosyltransferase